MKKIKKNIQSKDFQEYKKIINIINKAFDDADNYIRKNEELRKKYPLNFV